jgi:glucosamine--fructose-6-phosphate aminotransferase (isomerizing)
VLISRSGDTIEIKKLIDPLKKLGGSIIGITNVVASSLGSSADILIHLNSPADELIAIQTYTATIQTLDLLAEQIAGKLNQPVVQKQHDLVVASVEDTLNQYDRLFADTENHFYAYQPIYLLARGASLASASEGQLLFHEMAWSSATVYTAGHFRHGPWEVIDKGFLGFVFAPADPCYELNLRLVQDIARQGGHCCLISHHVPAGLPKTVFPYPIPALEPAQSPILEIIPVQFFIYHWAKWKGHQPGKFRASTPITLTEGEAVSKMRPDKES